MPHSTGGRIISEWEAGGKEVWHIICDDKHNCWSSIDFCSWSHIGKQSKYILYISNVSFLEIQFTQIAHSVFLARTLRKLARRLIKETILCRGLQIKSIMHIGSRVSYAKWHRIFVYMIIFGSKI